MRRISTVNPFSPDRKLPSSRRLVFDDSTSTHSQDDEIKFTPSDNKQEILLPSFQRRPFPDHSLLEALVRLEQSEWPQRDSEEYAVTHSLKSIFDKNPYLRKKSSFFSITIVTCIIFWALFKLLGGDEYLQRKYDPGLSDGQNKDNLFFISTITGLTLFFLTLTSSGSAHYIGRLRDEDDDRRANRQLIAYLIKEGYLISTDVADKNPLEYYTNIKILTDHLPLYFKRLLLTNNWLQNANVAIMGVILDAAQYIEENNIIAKLEDPSSPLGMDSPPQSPSPRFTSPPAHQRTPSFSTKLRQVHSNKADQTALRLRRFKEAGTSFTEDSVVVHGSAARQLYSQHEDRLQKQDAKLQELEETLHRLNPGVSLESLDANLIRNFPLNLMREYARITASGGLRTSARNSAAAISALLNDTFLQSRPELQTELLQAFFIPIEHHISSGEISDHTAETFSALPNAHQNRVRAKLFDDQFFESQTIQSTVNQCMLDTRNDDESLKATIYTHLSTDLTQTCLFCNLNPHAAGILLSRLCPGNHDSHLALIWEVIWSPTIGLRSRKIILFEIEKHTHFKTLHLFGYNQSGIYDAVTNILPEVELLGGHLLLAEIIEEIYLPKLEKAIKDLQELLLQNEKAKNLQKLLSQKQGIKAVSKQWSRWFLCQSKEKLEEELTERLRNQSTAIGDKRHVLNATLKAHITQCTTLLLGMSPKLLNHPKIQQTLLETIRLMMEASAVLTEDPSSRIIAYTESPHLFHLILFQFFGAPGRFNIKNVYQLLPFCEKVGIKTLFANLKAENQLPFSKDGNPVLIAHLGAALMYAYYQQNQSQMMKMLSIFCPSRAKQSASASRDSIQAVQQEIDEDDDDDLLSQAFSNFGIANVYKTIRGSSFGYSDLNHLVIDQYPGITVPPGSPTDRLLSSGRIHPNYTSDSRFSESARTDITNLGDFQNNLTQLSQSSE